MRYLLLLLALILLGCGPDRRIEKGSVTVDKVETVPTSQFLASPGKK